MYFHVMKGYFSSSYYPNQHWSGQICLFYTNVCLLFLQQSKAMTLSRIFSRITSKVLIKLLLFSLQTVATHLAITVEFVACGVVHASSLQNYPAWFAFGKGEEGSLHQFAWPVRGIWDSTYSGGNSIHINSKDKGKVKASLLSLYNELYMRLKCNKTLSPSDFLL